MESNLLKYVSNSLVPRESSQTKKVNLSKKKNNNRAQSRTCSCCENLDVPIVIRMQAIPRHKKVLYVLKPEFCFC